MIGPYRAYLRGTKKRLTRTEITPGKPNGSTKKRKQKQSRRPSWPVRSGAAAWHCFSSCPSFLRASARFPDTKKKSPAATARPAKIPETGLPAPTQLFASCRSLCTVLKDSSDYTIAAWALSSILPKFAAVFPGGLSLFFPDAADPIPENRRKTVARCRILW